MASSFLIPVRNKYKSEGLIFSQRCSSTQRYKNSVNCPKAFTTSTKVKEKLGLNPIKKVNLITRKIVVNHIDKMNKKFIKQMEEIHSNRNEIKRIIDEEGGHEKELFYHKLYKKKCDVKEKNFSYYRKELDKANDSYARTAMLNRMIEENKKKNKEENVNNSSNKEEEEKVETISNTNEGEIKEIINCMNELDYEKYLKDREIREALNVIKSKMEKEAQEKEENCNEEEKSNDNNEEGLKNEEEKQKNESDNNKTDDTDKKEEEQKQEKVSLPIIDKEKEKLKEKINEYHFVEKIAQEPVTYKSNKYRYSKESIQYNQSDSY